MKPMKAKTTAKGLVRELYGGEPYEYYPLGRHIVAAPGICGGRPTFKYTRLEVAFVLDLIAAGWSIQATATRFITGFTFARRAAGRFVAGDTAEDAIRAIGALNKLDTHPRPDYARLMRPREAT